MYLFTNSSTDGIREKTLLCLTHVKGETEMANEGADFSR